jgi:L-iditol 2-dehydrogenase
MKALLLTEPSRLEIQDLAEPNLESDQVLIRVAACGICGSDVHGYDGSSGRRIPPLIMGHEAAGKIERLGADVTGWTIGQNVTFDSTVYCGQCRYCRNQQVNLCDRRMVLGVSCGDYRRHGAFAEFVAVPARILYALPDGFPIEHAAMIEAVSVAMHAVDRAPVAPGGCALVVGTGMIGLLIVQCLRDAGWERIIATDLDDSRLALAGRFGAQWTLNAGAEDLPGQIKALTEGQGVEAAFEVVGATRTVQCAIQSVRKGGDVVLVGNLSPTVEIPLQAVVTRELRLHGSCASSGEYPRCIERMACGAIDVAPLISAIAPLKDGPAWFERLHGGEPGLMKVILKPS